MTKPSERENREKHLDLNLTRLCDVEKDEEKAMNKHLR